MTSLCTWSEVVPIDPGEGLDPTWASQFPLSARGRHVVTQAGERFRLRGVNWYGASDVNNVVGGLDVQRLDVICDTVRSLGFTVVRVPFSNEMLRSAVVPGSIDFDKNPELRGLSALEVLDEVVRCLGRHRVAVVLNNHTTHSEWCGGPDRNGLWFDPSSRTYTAEQWVEDWAMLAARYKRCPQVVGYDLRNEVRFCPWPFRWPSWNLGRGWRALGGCDWAEAAAGCCERLNEACPGRLLIIERVIWPMRGLQDYDVGERLRRFEKQLVFGVHHYAWNGPGRYLAFAHNIKGPQVLLKRALRALGIFSQENYGDMPSEELQSVLREQWGRFLETEQYPVWVSEFGSCGGPSYDLDWFEKFVTYLGSIDADFAYWPLNVGPKPGSTDDYESYGMLSENWTPKPEGDPRLKLMTQHGLLPSEERRR